MSFLVEKADQFIYIHRILNMNISGKRRVPYALREIKGIGRRFAYVLCKLAKVDPKKRAGELTQEEIKKITDIIDDPIGHGIPKWFVNRQKDFKDNSYSQMTSNVLDTKFREDRERLKKIKAHRGLRAFWGLRCRGQHTKTTGRRGVTMGVVKKIA